MDYLRPNRESVKIKYTGEGDACEVYVTFGRFTVTKKPQEVPDIFGEELLENYPLLIARADGLVDKLAMPVKTKGGE